MCCKKFGWTPLMLVAAVVFLTGCGGGGTDGPASEEPATPAATKSAPPAPAGSASIAGAVRYEGAVPTLRPLDMKADPGCAAKHSTAPRAESLVLGPNNALANVFVSVKGGLAAGSRPAPGDPVVIDQDGCRYVPHVLGVMVGQPLKILNSDGLLHNVHALPKTNKQFNMAMPANRTEAEHVFDKPESMFKIKCDVHPWMGAWVAVMTHPYYAVTGEDGQFSLAGLPAGTYEIEAWHEKLPAMTATVTVADGATETADFTFTR